MWKKRWKRRKELQLGVKGVKVVGVMQVYEEATVGDEQEHSEDR